MKGAPCEKLRRSRRNHVPHGLAGMIRREACPLPGDPGRVEGLIKALTEMPSSSPRTDYTTWLAQVENAPVLVMSTGMGGPCVTFAVEELARLAWKHLSGVTGSIQEDLHPGDVVIIRIVPHGRRFPCIRPHRISGSS
ncbi:MAG: hypothetical protein ACLUIQ_07595 [Dialister invisus]